MAPPGWGRRPAGTFPPPADAARVVDPGIRDDLSGTAPDANPADRADRDLRGQRPGPEADPRSGCAGPSMADGLLRRVLRYELHGVDDRVRRDPLPIHVRAADVGDGRHLPHRHRLGVRDRVAARAAAGPRVSAGGGPAAVPAEGNPAARAVPA